MVNTLDSNSKSLTLIPGVAKSVLRQNSLLRMMFPKTDMSFESSATILLSDLDTFSNQFSLKQTSWLYPQRDL